MWKERLSPRNPEQPLPFIVDNAKHWSYLYVSLMLQLEQLLLKLILIYE